VLEKPKRGIEFIPEVPNSVEIGDLPPHELKLMNNTTIMLMLTLDISEGICSEKNASLLLNCLTT